MVKNKYKHFNPEEHEINVKIAKECIRKWRKEIAEKVEDYPRKITQKRFVEEEWRLGNIIQVINILEEEIKTLKTEGEYKKLHRKEWEFRRRLQQTLAKRTMDFTDYKENVKRDLLELRNTYKKLKKEAETERKEYKTDYGHNWIINLMKDFVEDLDILIKKQEGGEK